MVGASATAFAKTICTICFEDLKPIVEDLQSISVCGHVFHELCLQQWFEYCKNGKQNCPVCKQSCSNANVARLYFQSIGDPSDSSISQKSQFHEETPEELRSEVKRLEGKVSGLTSVLEEKEKNLEEVCAQLLVWKERFKIEVALKDKILKEKTIIQQQLHLKSEEFDHSTLECKRLQERNMALAKELASLKLISDLNLEEDEVLKFASLGNDINSKEMIDVLKKSLVIRNKSYKELMNKCNILGRGEARSLNKLEKAKEKIKKLKERIKELESAVERKENNALRTLKASKEATFNSNTQNGSDQHSKNGECLSKNLNKEPAPLETDIIQAESMSDKLSSPRKKRKLKILDLTSNINVINTTVSRNDNPEKGPLLVDEYSNMLETCAFDVSCQDLKPLTENRVAIWKFPLRTEKRESETQELGLCNKVGVSGPAGPAKHNNADKPPTLDNMVMPPYDDMMPSQPLPSMSQETQAAAIVSGPAGPAKPNNVDKPAAMDDMLMPPYDDMLMPPYDDMMPSQPLPSMSRETQAAAVVSRPGDRCFSGALLGPDGTNWHLGKWCKRVHNKGQELQPSGLHGSTARTDNLIAIGADGRGGRIKVLRTLDQSSLDNKENQICARKWKYGAKASALQHGCMQIEHFFRRANQS